MYDPRSYIDTQGDNNLILSPGLPKLYQISLSIDIYEENSNNRAFYVLLSKNKQDVWFKKENGIWFWTIDVEKVWNNMWNPINKMYETDGKYHGVIPHKTALEVIKQLQSNL